MQKVPRSPAVNGGFPLEEPTLLSWEPQFESLQGSGPAEPAGVETQ